MAGCVVELVALFLLLGFVRARHNIHASSTALRAVTKAAASHSANSVWFEPQLSRTELIAVFDGVWRDMRDLCPSLPQRHSVDADFDDRLLDPTNDDYKYVIGYAERKEFLSGGVWQGALGSQSAYDYVASRGYNVMGKVRLARSPPGGWFRGAGSCSVKFRLEDVLRHEIMHLIGVSTTIRESDEDEDTLLVGRPYLGVCFPGAFDRLVENSAGQRVVDGRCRFSGNLGNEPFFVRAVQLFQYKEDWVQGTSMSHLRSVHAMLTPSVGLCEAGGPRPMTTLDADVLGGLNIVCDATKLTAAVDGTFTNPNFLSEHPYKEHNGSGYLSQSQPKPSAGRARSSHLLVHLCTLLSSYLLATNLACSV